MATHCSVRQAILADARKVIESEVTINRNTYEFTDDETIRINSTQDNSKTKVVKGGRKQAVKIAKNIQSRINKEYNRQVSAYVDDRNRYEPVTVKLHPNQAYVNHVYETQVKPEDKNEDSVSGVTKTEQPIAKDNSNIEAFIKEGKLQLADVIGGNSILYFDDENKEELKREFPNGVFTDNNELIVEGVVSNVSPASMDYLRVNYDSINVSEEDISQLFSENNVVYTTENGETKYKINNKSIGIDNYPPKLAALEIAGVEDFMLSVTKNAVKQFEEQEKKLNKLFVKERTFSQKELADDMKIRTSLTSDADITVTKNRVRIYNEENGTSFYPIFKQVGEAGYTVQLVNTDQSNILVEEYVKQLSKIFPELTVKLINENEITQYSPLATNSNSFVVGKTVYLIRERVTPDITIEEMLHPFVSGMFEQNRELFDSLLSEAKNDNPELFDKVQSQYNIIYTQEDINKEFLTRVLQQEYKKKNYSSGIIAKFLKWLSQLIDSIKRGGLYIADIPKNGTVRDIALLLKSGVKIHLGEISNSTFLNVKQSDAEILNTILSKATAEQKDTINQLVAASPVVFNEIGHTYVDKSDPSVIYTSVTTTIKGGIQDDAFSANREMGTQIDIISQAVVCNKTIDEVVEDLSIFPNLEEAVVRNFYHDFKALIAELTDDGTIVVPQMRIGDRANKLAGSPDLIIISPDGRIEGILDLKTSKNSVTWDSHTKNLYPSNLKNPSDGTTISLSTKEQHSLQVQGYQTILENNKFDVGDNLVTLHYKIGILGDKAVTIKRDSSADITMGIIDHTSPVLRHKDSKDISSPHFNVLSTVIKKTIFDENIEKDARVRDLESFVESTKLAIEAFEARTAVLQNRLGVSISSKAIGHDSLMRFSVDMSTVKELAKSYFEAGRVDTAYEILLNFLNTTFEKRQAFVLDYYKINNPSQTDVERVAKVLEESDADLSLAKKMRDVSSFNKNDEMVREIDRLHKNINELSELADEFLTNTYAKFWATSNSKVEITQEDITEILSQNYDITDASYYLRDLASSNSKILALLDRTYKRKLFEIDEHLHDLAVKFSGLGNAVISSHKGDKGTEYHYMLKKDKDGKITGNYVRRDGIDMEKYWEIWKRYTDPLLNPNATTDEDKWLQYNLDPVTQEDLDYNIQLYLKKQKRLEFTQAERIEFDIETGISEVFEGMYHRYSDEFEAERAKYETLEGWRWNKREDVSLEEYTKYKNKYYNEPIEITSISREDGELTGEPIKRIVQFVKNEYVIKKKIATNGESVEDTQWKEIMSWENAPEGSEQKAKYEFFQAFTKEYEDGMLAKLPEDVRNKMQGKISRQKSSAFVDASMKLKGNILKRFLQSMKEFFSFRPEDVSVFVNEEGYEDNRRLPIFFTGDFKNVKNIQNLEKQIADLKEAYRTKTKDASGKWIDKAQTVTDDEFSQKLKSLNNLLNIEKGRITKGELETDLTKNILSFARMSEYYYKMQEMETTLFAIEKIILKTDYKKRNNIAGYLRKKGEFEEAANVEPVKSFTYQRFNAWKDMVFYRNVNPYKPKYAQFIRKMMQMMSLRSVGLNLFGQVNNYLIGRMSNSIERNRFGGKLPYYFDRSVFNRATTEYNKFSSFFGKNPETGYYQVGVSPHKYEAVIKYFDAVRQNQTSLNVDERGISQQIHHLGYIMMEKAEFAIQSKTAMSIIMAVQLEHETTGEKSSLYDVLVHDPKTGVITIKDGYKFTDTQKFDVKNLIWEVNKQIHGNYAYEDRMVLQRWLLGDIAAQFRKYLIPAIDARFRDRMYHEDKGWIEGRYKSYVKMYRFMMQGKMGVMQAFNSLDDLGKQNMLKNMHEAAFLAATIIATAAFKAAGAGADDKTVKKFFNMLSYQSDRLESDLLVYMPIIGIKQDYQIIKNPAAIVTYLVDYFQVADAALKTIGGNPVYKTGFRKGDYRIVKEINDILPIMQQLNKWENFETIKDFYIR